MELVALKAYVMSLGSRVLAIKKRVANLTCRMEAMAEFGYKAPYNLFKLSWNVTRWPSLVNVTHSRRLKWRLANEKKMHRTLEKEQLQFKELIVTLGKRVEAYSEIGGSDPERDYDLAAVVDEAINLDSALKMAVEKS